MEKEIFFAKNLNYLRRRKKLSQVQLAKELEISRNKIASYEGKGIEPKLSILIKMAEFFEVSLDDFLTKNIHNVGFINVKKSNVTLEDMDESLEQSIQDFASNVNHVEKIVEGYQHFREMKKINQLPDNSGVFIDSKGLFYITEHLLKSCKSMLTKIKSSN